MRNVYGYIRVSSRDQNEDRQMIAASMIWDSMIPMLNSFSAFEPFPENGAVFFMKM